MNIIFMGTPEFAVASLAAIVASSHTVSAVVTAPDKPAGRGRSLQSSAVKQYAEAHNIPVLQPHKLRDEDFLKELQAYEADLFAVVAFRMLPKVVWDMPAKGTINLHGSLLPNYRGAAPINWAVIHGETKSGATTFFLNEDIDTGDLIDRVEVAIGPNDNAGDLHDKLMQEGAALLVRTLNQIEAGTVRPQKQILSGKEKSAPKLFKENTALSTDLSTAAFHNKVRGLSPYPGAHATLKNGEQEVQVKILETEHVSAAEQEHGIGSLFQPERKKLFLQLRDGVLSLKSLQVEGKKRMAVVDFLNGTTLEKGAKLL
jgi:methionyl-tRNA formyltransferase